MTYNVFSGTLNPAQSIMGSVVKLAVRQAVPELGENAKISNSSP